jgi:broad specificity phosphatase PhoE
MKGGSMAKVVELRRHTDNDGDVLSDEGVATAIEIGASLRGDYELAVSSGAQRSTQTIGCFLASLGQTVARGVVVEPRFKSDVEDRWRDAYERGGGGDISSFLGADPELVASESAVLGAALADVFERLSDGARALVVGHSPMQEAAVYGVTGEKIEPLSKGAGVVVVEESGTYRVEAAE